MPTGKILASTFNLVQSKVGAIIGPPSGSTSDLGYNLGVSSYQVSVGANKIRGNDLNLIIQDLNVISKHQTADQTALDTFAEKQLITQADLTPIANAADTLYTNRNKVGVGELSLTTSNSYSDGTDWTTTHSHSIRLDWGSNAEFRGWANLAGFVTINIGMSGGKGSQQETSWINMLASIGTIVIGAKACILENQSASTSQYTFPNGSLYNLIANGQIGVNATQLFKITDTDNHYTGNKLIVYCIPFGGTGLFDCKGFDLTVELTDGHLPATNTTDDTVTTTLAMTVNTYFCFDKIPTATDLGNSIT